MEFLNATVLAQATQKLFIMLLHENLFFVSKTSVEARRMGRIPDEPIAYLGFWHSVLVTLSFIEQGESPLVLWHQVTDKYGVLVE